MATYKRLPREKNSRGKEVETWTDKLWKQIMQQWKKIAYVVGSIIILVGISSLVIWQQNVKNEEIQLQYLELMKASDEAAKAAGIEEFAEKYSGHEVSYLAKMWLGSYYFRTDDLEKSKDSYDYVVKKSDGNPIYYLAVDAIVPMYIDLGQAKEGADLYLEVSKKRSNPRPYLYKMNAAATYELAGDKTKAEEIYKEILGGGEEVPTTVKLKAEEQLLWLAASK